LATPFLAHLSAKHRFKICQCHRPAAPIGQIEGGSGKIRKNSQKAEWNQWYQPGETTNEKPFKPKTIFFTLSAVTPMYYFALRLSLIDTLSGGYFALHRF
jgi:hypothetical protein